MRNYVDPSFDCSTWEAVEHYYQDLLSRNPQTKDEFFTWLKDKSELEAVLEENMAWRYIKMTIDTTDKKRVESYQFFVTEIQPKLAPLEDQLNKRMMDSPYIGDFEKENEAYSIYFRGVRTALELFRENNIPIETELNTLSQEYGAISGKQTIEYEGKTLTMPQAAIFLKNPDENIRKQVFELIAARRQQDTDKLDELFTRLVKLRHELALNAGCRDFREYKFKSLGRFDYSVEDCLNFHRAIEDLVVPITRKLSKKQADALGKELLKPWDADVDPEGKEPLKPFSKGNELLDTSIRIFDSIDPYFGQCLSTMKSGGYLDLDSKPGKAPGGYNYPLYESGIPFIFMNAAGSQRDVTTMVHEGGHAVHSFLSRDLELTGFKSLPSEVAELASMSMELMTMDRWSAFYKDPADLNRAKREQLESIVRVLPWIATIDAFQHWIYTHPDHSTEERTEEWKNISKRFGTGMTDYSGYEFVRNSSWQRQLHLFEVPFYYIEYGIAQLGALGVWKNFRANEAKAVERYKAALKLGYTRSIPEIYAAAGLRFDFSAENVGQLMEEVAVELEKLS